MKLLHQLSPACTDEKPLIVVFLELQRKLVGVRIHAKRTSCRADTGGRYDDFSRCLVDNRQFVDLHHKRDRLLTQEIESQNLVECLTIVAAGIGVVLRYHRQQTTTIQVLGSRLTLGNPLP